MLSNLLGNPHSSSAASQLSTRRIENVRLDALRFFNADPDRFDLIFVANATAGIKLVMDAFRDSDQGFWFGYHVDSHTSMVGVREAATLGHRCFTSNLEVEEWLRGPKSSDDLGSDYLGLFAYPAQSNMNGRRLPLSWPRQVRSTNDVRNRTYTLLDAASLAATSAINLGDVSVAPDYIAISFTKIFGFPDLGGLIVRKQSGRPLVSRKYFSGGTVQVTCVTEQWHIKKEDSLHEQLEDGTLPIHNIVGLGCALKVYRRLYGSIERVTTHTSRLTRKLYNDLSLLRHQNGRKVCQIFTESSSIYGAGQIQGPIIALVLIDHNGNWVSNYEVEKVALIRNIQFRIGGVCNPGGVSAALGLCPEDLKRNFSAGHRCGNENDIIGGKPTGVIRVSLGAMSNLRDVSTFVEFIKEFFVDQSQSLDNSIRYSQVSGGFFVEKLGIFPIKSCGEWSIPSNILWHVRPEGLAWDREWCLVHQGSRAPLSQKKYPRMALIKPSIDLENELLRVQFIDPNSAAIHPELTIPLSSYPSQHRPLGDSKNHISNNTITPNIYTSKSISHFFTTVLETPCTLARHPGLSPGVTKSRKVSASEPMPGAFPTPTPPAPLLANQSPILTISRSSLNRLNEQIKATNGKAAHASVFRANILLAESGPAIRSNSSSFEQPYVEDTWRSVRIVPEDANDEGGVTLQALGACQRCGMVGVDQSTAQRDQEPFITLAKTRRVGGKVLFGRHMALMEGSDSRIRVGMRVVPEREGEGLG